jgi:hypothetical protein
MRVSYTAPERSLRAVMAAAVRLAAQNGGVFTRAELVEAAGMSIRTVKRLVPVLLEQGAIKEPIRGVLTYITPGASVAPSTTAVLPKLSPGASMAPAGASVAPSCSGGFYPPCSPLLPPPHPPTSSPLTPLTPPVQAIAGASEIAQQELPTPEPLGVEAIEPTPVEAIEPSPVTEPEPAEVPHPAPDASEPSGLSPSLVGDPGAVVEAAVRELAGQGLRAGPIARALNARGLLNPRGRQAGGSPWTDRAVLTVLTGGVVAEVARKVVAWWQDLRLGSGLAPEGDTARMVDLLQMRLADAVADAGGTDPATVRQAAEDRAQLIARALRHEVGRAKARGGRPEFATISHVCQRRNLEQVVQAAISAKAKAAATTGPVRAEDYV